MVIDIRIQQDLFTRAAEISDSAERQAFLNAVCGTDEVLRSELEELLRHDAAEDGFLSDAVPALTVLARTGLTMEEPGTIIGPYRLLEQIGEGGFGVVFMAEQTAPIRRSVAIKIIKPGMDSRQVVARFAAEQQALTLMDHPNIARVLDAGTTATGRPYFVMELLRGKPITEYCRSRSATLDEIIHLFLDVCRAVQHAHQKGIIHRDLKPSNVLVSDQDGEARIKVIDFGIAKAISPENGLYLQETGFSQLLGTPMYMSPEQAAMSADIDTRSDIYSLGVLLYELLCGEPPFDIQRLKRCSFDELRRIIQEEDPPLPGVRSLRLENEGDGNTRGRNELSRHPALRKNDLDWIVQKAMDKDRRQRYDSVGDLQNDLRRYLQNEPVLARPRSLSYRLHKLARRNWLALSFTAAAIAGTVVIIGNLIYSNSAIRREQALAENARHSAERALRLAEDRAAEIREGLERLIEANAQLERGYWYAERQHWDDADKAYSKAVALQPNNTNALVVRSELRGLLGLWEMAAADYAREMELHESELTWRWFRHALLRLEVGDEAGYRHACQRMLTLFAGTTASDMASEVVRACVLTPDAEVDLARLLQIQHHAVATDPASWLRQYILGTAQYRAGEYVQAVASLQRSLSATNLNVRGLCYPVLAMAYAKLGQMSDARRTLETAAEQLENWTQYRCSINDGNWVVHRGATVSWPIAWWDWIEFHVYYREAWQLIRGTSPPPDGRAHVLRARSLAALRWRDEAEQEYGLALSLLPDDSQVKSEALCNLGDRAVDRHQFAKAADHYAKARELQPRNIAVWRFLAVACLAAGDHDQYRRTAAGMLQQFQGTQDRFEAGNLLQVCTLTPDSLDDFHQLEPLLPVVIPDWHSGTWTRAGALYRTGRIEECLQVLEAAPRVYRPTARDWAFRSMANMRLGRRSEAARCLAEARRWVDIASERRSDDLSGTQPAWGAWDDQIAYPLLILEADALLQQTQDEPATGVVP